MSIIPTPAGQVVRRPLQFFWLADCSGSMSGPKIASLNQAIREAIPAINDALKTHPEVAVKMRAIKFSSTASWHVGPDQVAVEDFHWPELQAEGYTATAEAIQILAAELDSEKMPRRGYPPVCILLSDGCCSESEGAYDAAIAALEKLPWGKKAVRLAVAIGNESDYDEVELLKFTSHKEVGVLKAHNSAELVNYIKWASVAATVGASAGKNDLTAGNIALPVPPPVAITDSTDVF